jgi:glycogen debranching enzyme
VSPRRTKYFTILIESLGYSPSNTSHLTPALELDDAILEFSGSLQGSGLPTHVTSQKDVDTLMGAFEEHLKSKDLWQFYVLDMQEEKAAILSVLSSNSIVPWNGEDVSGKSAPTIANIVRSSGLIRGLGKLSSRYCAHVDGGIAAGIMKAAFVHNADDDQALAEGWERVVDVLNVPLYADWEEDTRIALHMIKNRLKYIRLDSNGPKLVEISKECVCVALHEMSD